MKPLTVTLLLALFIANGMAFALMGMDKAFARRGKGRIPEKTLLLWCAMMGALGGYAGMGLFRHKTQKPLFTSSLPPMLLVQGVLTFYYFVYVA